MNSLSNSLHDVYNQTKSVKELWHAKEQKYEFKDAGNTKFLVSCLFEFKMVQNKLCMKQMTSLQLFIHSIHAEKLELNETFQIANIIKKLSPTWSVFKVYVKHKTKEMILVELLKRINVQGKYLNVARRVHKPLSSLVTIVLKQTIILMVAGFLREKKTKMDMVQGITKGLHDINLSTMVS